MSDSTNITSTFIDKLKEQSFTIILLVAIMYYMNVMFTQQIAEYHKLLDEKDKELASTVTQERVRLLEHDKYLRDQRDQYVQDLIRTPATSGCKK